jgi:hypothetical protein
MRILGSQIQLEFLTKFPTFTPEQFNRALKEKNYFMTQSQISIAQKSEVQPFIAPVFSKGNLSVILLQSNELVFQILNAEIIEKIIQDDIKEILVPLNITRDVIERIMFDCSATVMIHKGEPIKSLTNLVKKNVLEKMQEPLEPEIKLAVTSIRLTTEFPVRAQEEATEVVLEPFGSSPKNQFFLNIHYQTPEMSKFDAFIRRFSDDMVEKIIEGVIEYAG